MNLKKNPIEKYFFIMEKNDFEKNLEKIFEKFRFFQLKNRNFSNIFSRFFFKIIFLHDEKIFFDGIFLKVQLQIQENRLEAVSGRSRQYKPSNLQGKKVGIC